MPTKSSLSFLLLVLLLSTVTFCDVVPHFPHDPATTPYCTWWVDNGSTISCTDFISTQNITITDFIRWNPFITTACGNFGRWASYCVEAFNEPIVKATCDSQIAANGPATADTLTLCDLPCNGNASEICGLERINVFHLTTTLIYSSARTLSSTATTSIK
ncbi:hypothetical protein B0O99DRAFT_591046 [Bisporella sp. PMI_857]|nr:hypothetical protein B0O99DRAFT_591046 [Bisporella sp. PMI_857]